MSDHNTYSLKFLKRVVTGIVVISFLQGCGSPPDVRKEAKDRPFELELGKRMSLTPDKKEQPLKLDVNKRMLLDSARYDGKKPEKTFRFRAKKMPIVMALDLFARNNNLNIITSPEVTGNITVDFNGLPFEKAMEAILHAYGYYWTKEEGLIQVYKYETRLFIIDYIKLIREGKGSSQASLSSSSGGEAGNITLTQSDTVNFWKDLEKQLKIIVSDEGKLTINIISGTIHVTDFHKIIVQMERFINSITRSIKRQVQIDVKILEVLLSDDFSLGIDWDLIIKKFSGIDINASTIVTTPLGVNAKSPTIKLDLGLFGSDFNAIIDALNQQGELTIISRPTIRVMNNQPALIKVGTDRPFFNQTQIASTTPGQGNTITEEVEFITEGLVLSITPQISEDGWIILDVTPIISRLVETVVSTLGSTAPMMDVKQSSTIVRLRDGEMVTVGGLIQDLDSKSTRKIPLLGDIPFLGNAFKGTYTAKSKSELVIFITPTIIKDM